MPVPSCFFTVYLKKTSNILSLAVKNIETSFIFLARLFVYLQLVVKRPSNERNFYNSSAPLYHFNYIFSLT